MKTLTEEFIDKINKMESKSINVILIWAHELRIKQNQQTKELREEIERLKGELDKIRTENIAFRIKIIDKGFRS